MRSNYGLTKLSINQSFYFRNKPISDRQERQTKLLKPIKLHGCSMTNILDILCCENGSFNFEHIKLDFIYLSFYSLILV